jgi:hypothetical protein
MVVRYPITAIIETQPVIILPGNDGGACRRDAAATADTRQ